MSDIDDFADMMTQAVTVQPFVSRNQYGAAAYASPLTYKARVNFKTHWVRGPEGEQIVARGVAWINTGDDTITVNDLVTLPDGTMPKILQVNGENDESGPLYTRLDFA